MNELDEFTLMQDFLSFFDPQVEMRDGKPLEDSERSLLEKIAQGEASDSDRETALQVLRSDSAALEFLAQQLKQN